MHHDGALPTDRRTVLQASAVLAGSGLAIGGYTLHVTETALSAEVGAEGQVVFQPDDADPTPTPP